MKKHLHKIVLALLMIPVIILMVLSGVNIIFIMLLITLVALGYIVGGLDEVEADLRDLQGDK